MKLWASITEQAWHDIVQEITESFTTMDKRTRHAKHQYDLARQEFLGRVEELATIWFNQRLHEYKKR